MSPAKKIHEIDKTLNELEDIIRSGTEFKPRDIKKYDDALKAYDEDFKKHSELKNNHRLYELQALIYLAARSTEHLSVTLDEALIRSGGVNNLTSPLLKSYISHHSNVKTTHNEQTLGGRVLGTVASLVVLAVVYGLINLVFVGGQNAFKHGDKERYEQLKQQVEKEKASLELLDSTIASEEATLLRMEQQMDQYKQAGNISAYNNMVDPYNNRYTAYENYIANYNSRLPNYNANAEELNKLAKEVGSTYYIVPMPTGKRSN